MPLTAEYTWVESETMIQLQVPLKGQAKAKVDVFATECYVKISFPPYLLELDLDGRIDSRQHSARIANGTLVIKAKKKEGSCGLWGTLGRKADRKCDPEVKTRRDESIKEHLKREQELKERVSLRKHEDERLALRSQMNVEEDERRRIEDVKAEEKEKAEADVYRSFAELAAKQHRGEIEAGAPPLPLTAQPTPASEKQKRSMLPLSTEPAAIEWNSSSVPDTITEDSSGEEGSPVPMATSADDAVTVVGSSIWEGTGNDRGDEDQNTGGGDGSGGPQDAQCSAPGESIATTSEPHTTSAEDDDGAVESYVPAPRVVPGVVSIDFTTRLFPTPLRESKVADESAWIMKNRRHLHKNKTLVGRLPSEETMGMDDLPLDISESDPVWLKGKGDDFYRGGDFRGAINAYTAALDADPKVAACLSNRAACHLRLGHCSECVADCAAALQILRMLPETGPNQARALARRALAYRNLGHYRLSLEDWRATLMFNPGDTALTGEIQRTEPLAKCEAAKNEAVKRFATGDIDGACEMYTTALACVPAFPSCLSNRAACHLALGRPLECVRDCTTVLELLSADPLGDTGTDKSGGKREQNPTTSKPTMGSPPGSMPPAGSEKRRQWVLTTMMRRGRANVELGCLERALQDYRAASLLAPGDKAVAGDVAELERRVTEAEAEMPLGD